MSLETNKETFTNQDLSPCPCCGGEAQCSEISSLFNIPGDICEKIQCSNCGLTIVDSYGKAKMKWNTRSSKPTQLKTVEATTKCSKCFHYDVCDRYPFDESGCKSFYPGTEVEQLQKAKEELVQAIIDSPLGKSMSWLIDRLAEAIDNIARKE